MAEKVRTRERDIESQEGDTRLYEPQDYKYAEREAQRAAHGRIVVRGKERTWDLHAQSKIKLYLSPLEPELADTATQHWQVFFNVFNERSGKHKHQGGLVIFILEGKGYTIIEGERHDWEAGDLTLLRVQPGGVEHQHFSADPDKPVKWVALKYFPFFDYCGCEMVPPIENSPIYDQWVAKNAERLAAASDTRKTTHRKRNER